MNNPQNLAFDVNDLPEKTDNSSSIPSEIVINDINLDLNIFPAELRNGRWEVSTKGASWLSSSPVPGTKGNSIIYGHYWPNLLGHITKLKPGEVIKIKFADGSTKVFVIDSTVAISPNDVNILKPSKNAQITLYTCTGFLDNKRFVVVAKPKE